MTETKNEWLKLEQWTLRNKTLFRSVNKTPLSLCHGQPHTVGKELSMTVMDG